MVPESDASDTLKPDGLGFHHRAAYPGGYAAYAYQQSALAVWLLRNSKFACQPVTVSRLCKGLETLIILSNKYEMHRALHGRLVPRPTIVSILTAYAFLSDLEHPQKITFQKHLTRLADEKLLAMPNARRIFFEHRNEIPPGPGGITRILKIIEQARKVGAAQPPQGHWTYGYGPLSVHRRDNWMVCVKGHSKYWWAFERSLTDGRMDARRENVLGFHDGSGNLMIFSPDPADPDSYSRYRYGEGWDWCLVPGTTTRHIPAQTLVDLDTRGRKFNRPFAPDTLVGGVNISGKQGLFSMEYQEVGPDQPKSPLRARKSFFFFDDVIVALTSGIHGEVTHTISADCNDRQSINHRSI